MTTALQTSAVVIQLPVFSKEIAISSEWLTKRNDAVAKAQEVKQVTCQAEFDAAGEALARVTKLDNGIEKMRKELTAPFLAAQKTIKAKVDEACVPLETEKARLKQIAGDWQMSERKRIATEAAEAELKAREAAEEELERQQMEREQAEALGLDAPPPLEVVEVATPVVAAPVSDNAKVTMRVSFEVLDEDKVPRAFLMFDPRKVNEYIRQNKAEIMSRVDNGEAEVIVDGLRFTARPDVSGR